MGGELVVALACNLAHVPLDAESLGLHLAPVKSSQNEEPRNRESEPHFRAG